MALCFTDRTIPISQFAAVLLSGAFAAAADPLADLGQMYLAGRCREYAAALRGRSDLLIDTCHAIAMTTTLERSAIHLGDVERWRDLAERLRQCVTALRALYLWDVRGVASDHIDLTADTVTHVALTPFPSPTAGRGADCKSGLAAAIYDGGDAGATRNEESEHA